MNYILYSHYWFYFYTCIGHTYVIGVYRKNTPCSLWRYQPFKLWSNELSRCVFAKSGCNELGQIMYDMDSALSDNVCWCDHAEGFSFLYVPKNHCYCIPTQEDCTCYKKMSSEDHVLTAGENNILEKKMKKHNTSTANIWIQKPP